jgi:hypothetical protein
MKSPLKKDYIFVICQAQAERWEDSFRALTITALILTVLMENQVRTDKRILKC